jgi:hypothetical protein
METHIYILAITFENLDSSCCLNNTEPVEYLLCKSQKREEAEVNFMSMLKYFANVI